MSVRFLSRVWDTPCESHAQKLILLALADNSDDQGVSWPSLRTISRKCDLCERSVRYGLRELCRKGHIKIIFRKDKRGDPSTSLYQILGGAPNAPGVGHQMPQGGARDAPGVGQEMPPNRNREPSLNRHGEGKRPLYPNEYRNLIKDAESEIEAIKGRGILKDSDREEIKALRVKINLWKKKRFESD